MTQFDIQSEWADWSAGVDAREVDATLARIEIVVNGINITRTVDAKTSTVHDRLLVPLYPIAEWIAGNWWALLEEPEVPSRGTSTEDYRRRHDLATGREGFLFPDLNVYPEGLTALLTWGSASASSQRIRFVEAGAARVNLEQLKQELTNLIEAVLQRLEKKGVGDTWLQREWPAITQVEHDVRRFCIAAGKLGLDPFDLTEEWADSITRAAEVLSPHLVTEVVTASPLLPSLLEASIQWVAKGVSTLEAGEQPDDRWLNLRDNVGLVSTDDDPPWQTGYALAARTREVLKIGSNVVADMKDVFGLAATVVEADRPPAASFDGLFSAGAHTPCCYTSKRHPTSQRFLFARGLADLLLHPVGEIRLYSAAQTTTQQRNRAFAAEFLAPADLIRQRLSGDDIGVNEVEDLASAFDVSTWVIDHQIRNRGLGTVVSGSGQFHRPVSF